MPKVQIHDEQNISILNKGRVSTADFPFSLRLQYGPGTVLLLIQSWLRRHSWCLEGDFITIINSSGKLSVRCFLLKG